MNAFRLFRPRSFLSLVLLGFSLVSLPLFLALLLAGSYVDRLERQGTGALYRAVSATQGSRALLEHVVSLERKARQYAVLGDETARLAYWEEDEQTQASLRELWRSRLSSPQREALVSLAGGLRTLSSAMGLTPAEVKKEAVAFERLNELAKSVLAQSNQMVLEEADALEAITRKAKTSLAWQALAAVPAALAFGVLFTLLISRPVRQIDRAIRRLGGGDFSSEISVAGPGDLEALGKTIDWLRRRLLDLQGEKFLFLARASHDLKTPLTAVREGADLLLEEAIGPLGPQQQEVAKILRDNTLRLQRSIQGLLDYSVAEAKGTPAVDRQQSAPLRGESIGKLRRWYDPRMQLVPLKALVSEVLADNGPAAVRKELTLRAEGPDLRVLGDREQLRVVLDNLVSNSVKFTPAGGSITVVVSSDGRTATVDVTDTGPGIELAERERVFEDFYQGKVSSDGPIRGSGLGLSIAREQVERHGGRLDLVESANGAHFRVVLPIGTEGNKG